MSRPALTSIVIAHANGEPLAKIGRDHNLTRSKLRTILIHHSIYCFGRIENFMVRRVKFPKKALFGLLLGLLCNPAYAQSPAQVVAPVAVVWDSNTTVANATIPILNPQWAGGGRIVSVTYYTNGSSPSFAIAVKIGGTNVTGCNALTVNSSSATTTSCTAANTFTNSSQITLVISSASGTPNQALVQINMTTSLN